jgi:hypothetical protein
MAKRIGDRGEKLMIEPGDNPWKIAAACVGDGRRWRELVDANPQKQRSDVTGSFVSLMPGEVLRLPGAWLVKMGGVPLAPIVHTGGEVGSLHDAGSLSSSPPAPMHDAAGATALPYGWTDSALDIVVGMARGWKMPPEDLMAIWFSESGAQPRCRSVGAGCIPTGQPMPEGKIGYYGLIMGADKFVSPTLGWPAGTWERIVTKEAIATQLQAIAQFWDRLQKIYLGESATDRAERIGVSTASVIYALNFVPAYAKRATSASSVLVRKGDGTGFYEANAGLDSDQDGAITMKDMEARVIDRRNALASGGAGRQLYLAVRDAAGGAVPSLATLWAPITSAWQDLTGKNPVMTVGLHSSSDGPMGPGERGAGLVETIAVLAAIAAAAHYGWPYVAKLLRKG